MDVQILSKKLITPSSPTPHHLQNLKLPWMSQCQSPRIYSPRIYYYPNSGKCHGAVNMERSKKLQNSLSETLSIFYPLAGRFTDDLLAIDCNDQGVEYIEARVSGCLSQLLDGGELETELRNHLSPKPLQPENRPLVLVQFNMFDCGGVAIAVCIKHRVGDGLTSSAFINSWATACRIGVDKIERPSFELSSFFPPRDVPVFVPRFSGDKKVEIMKRFMFTGAALSNLKAIAGASSTGSHDLLKRQPTRVEAVIGLIWRTLAMVDQERRGRLRPSLISVTFNLRGKVAMPIPDNCFGIFASTALAHFTVSDDQSKIMQLHDFVNRVHSGLKTMATDCSKVSSDDDLFSLITGRKKEMLEAFNGGEIDLYMFSSSCRVMHTYEADFGWGKPGWFSPLDVPGENMILLIDTEDGEGIEAWVTLEEKNMLLFQENPDIKEFTAQKRSQLHH